MDSEVEQYQFKMHGNSGYTCNMQCTISFHIIMLCYQIDSE